MTENLEAQLRAIDGAGYGAYRKVRGRHRLGAMTLHVDHVQGDPFAAPSRLRVRLPIAEAGFPPETWSNRSREVALRDWIARRFAAEAAQVQSRRGSGKSGAIGIDAPGQQVLERTAVRIDGEAFEVRFTVGLPARGRRVLGREAAALLCEDVPELVERTLRWEAHDPEEVWAHLEVAEDADAMRAQLWEHGLVAFVANGALLPRRSGADPRPMTGDVVPFRSPTSLEVELIAPNAGALRGMGIATGITLIVGGGYHGKSTLLDAIARGIWNHRPGDGRERVVTDPDALRIRAEDGRSVSAVDISPFIGELPGARSTRAFTTADASGSTSQAASIIEALEVGAKVLLMDEDTCATNFMIRDHRMQRLVAGAQEPITPFLDKVEQLRDELGVSTLLVMGGSGDYFDVADRVIRMRDYRPEDVSAEARAIASAHPTRREGEGGHSFGALRARAPDPASIDPSSGKRDVRLRVRETDEVGFGEERIDTGALVELVDRSQLEAIAAAIVVARDRWMDGKCTLAAICDALEEAVAREGLDALDGRLRGDLAQFRRHEFAAVLNRLRTLRADIAE